MVGRVLSESRAIRLQLRTALLIRAPTDHLNAFWGRGAPIVCQWHGQTSALVRAGLYLLAAAVWLDSPHQAYVYMAIVVNGIWIERRHMIRLIKLGLPEVGDRISPELATTWAALQRLARLNFVLLMVVMAFGETLRFAKNVRS